LLAVRKNGFTLQAEFISQFSLNRITGSLNYDQQKDIKDKNIANPLRLFSECRTRTEQV
jgi:hypothetical protein